MRKTVRAIRCPLCEAILEIGITKRGLPYIICGLCGIQIFFRWQTGIRRLEAKSFAIEVEVPDGEEVEEDAETVLGGQ